MFLGVLYIVLLVYFKNIYMMFNFIKCINVNLIYLYFCNNEVGLFSIKMY